MTQSEPIKNIATALIEFRRAVEKPHKNAENPHFKSGFADINEINDVIRDPMCANGLSYVQGHCASENGVTVETLLMHTSGEWIKGSLFIPAARNDPQGFGSASTYARRYSLEAILGLRAVDDDAEGAQGRGRDFQQRDHAIDAHEAKREDNARARSQRVEPQQPAKPCEYKLRPPAAAEADDEIPMGEESKAGDWKDVTVHFGKNINVRLGDLEPTQLRWYQKEWQPRPFRGRMNEKDVTLRAALERSMGKEPSPAASGEDLEEVPF